LKSQVLKEEEWEAFAVAVVKNLKVGDRVALYGDLGAGKTSFVRACLRAWGWSDVVASPSYPLMIEYEISGLKIIHIDAFRLQPGQLFPGDPSEWGTSIVFVEWPDRVQLGPYTHELRLEILEAERRLSWKAFDASEITRHT